MNTVTQNRRENDRPDGGPDPSMMQFGRNRVLTWIGWGCALIAVGHVILNRLVWLAIPLQTDTGMWAYIGGRILEGALPYRDLWESKPPGIYYLFAAVESCFGDSAFHGLVWLDGVLSVAVFAITYRIATRLTTRWAAGCALLPLSLVFGHRVLSDWGDNLEKFVALFEMIGIALVFRQMQESKSGSKPPGMRFWMVAGVCAALASMFKQTGLVLIAATMILGIIQRLRPSTRLKHFDGRALLGIGLGFVAAWLPVLMYLVLSGMGPGFLEQAVLYDLSRAGAPDGEGGRLVSAAHWRFVGESFLLGLVLLGPALVVIVRPPRMQEANDGTEAAPLAIPQVTFLRTYAGLALLPMALAPHGYGHYLLHSAPACAILFAVFLCACHRRRLSRPAFVVSWLLIGVGLWNLRDHVEFMIRGDTANGAYSAQRDRMADVVRAAAASPPDSAVLLWPPDYAASYYAGRRTPLECSNADVIFKGKYYRLSPTMAEILDRLKSAPPAVLIDTTRVMIVTATDDPIGAADGDYLRVEPGLSLVEAPNPRHPLPEGRLLADFKTWIREHYGGQERVGRCTLYYLGRPWREWTDYHARDEDRSTD